MKLLSLLHFIRLYMLTRLACLLCLWICALPAYAQDEIEAILSDTMPLVNKTRARPLRFLELGVSANSYKGDLSQYEKWTACYHAGLRFNGVKRWNSRIGLGYGFITGENRAYKFAEGTPNNFFRTSVFFLSYEVHYNILKTQNFMLYASAGLGIYNYTPKTELGENLTDLLSTRALDEQYGRVSFMLPVGLGAVYLLKNGYGIGAQASFLNVQTDYLDNISQWGKQGGNDNVASFRFFIYAPLVFSKPTILPTQPKRKTYYSKDF